VFQAIACNSSRFLLNLVVNGMDAMNAVEESRRMLIISVRHEVCNGRTEVLVSVQDAGTGLKAEEMARLFESFYTTKPQEMGMDGDKPLDHRGSWRAVVGPSQRRTWRNIFFQPAVDGPDCSIMNEVEPIVDGEDSSMRDARARWTPRTSSIFAAPQAVVEGAAIGQLRLQRVDCHALWTAAAQSELTLAAVS